MDNGIGVIIGKVAFLGWPVLYGRLVAFGLMCAGIDKFDKFDVGTVTRSSYELQSISLWLVVGTTGR